MTHANVINGDYAPAESGKQKQIIEPATGKVIASVADSGPEDILQAIAAAQQAFASGSWRRMKPRQRGNHMLAVADLVRNRSEELARLEVRNTGKPIREARDEVGLAADCFQYYAGAVDKFGGITPPVSGRGVAMTFREPIGVCALIVPWNFPIAITAWKLAPALAMGNAVVLKPAEATPFTALELGKICLEASIPPGVVNIVTGPGRVIGESLVRHPMVRKVSFTGSTEVGRQIMVWASEGMKRLTLELGGKSANIVFADADLEKAADSAVWSVLGNAGQDCCARSRLLVERKVHDEFLAMVEERFASIRIGDPLDDATEIGSLISASHRSRVIAYVERGKAEGAVLRCGGTIPRGAPFDGGAFLTPAIFSDAKPDMSIVREEIFGPVVSVLTFDTEEEGLRLANDSEYGLSGSVWTRDGGKALRVARSMETGVISVNSGSSVHLEAPFGGMKSSGFGRELGMSALEHYTELKSVFVSTDP